MSGSGRSRRPNNSGKGSFGFTGPSRGGGKSTGKAGKDPSGGRAGELFAPPSVKGPAGSPYGIVSRTNNDGNLATRQSPGRRPRVKSPCFITTACVEARGLPDDCCELRLLRLFRAEYVAKLPEAARILDEYRRKAPVIVRAIRELPEMDAARVWDHLYERGVLRAVGLITNGRWDEAYELYASMCRQLERRFVTATVAEPPGSTSARGVIPAAGDTDREQLRSAGARPTHERSEQKLGAARTPHPRAHRAWSLAGALPLAVMILALCAAYLLLHPGPIHGATP